MPFGQGLFIFAGNTNVMKILALEQIREADRYTIENEPIASADLMERAANALFQWLLPRLRKEQGIHIFCGIGNNGGDGLVLARLLVNQGFDVNTSVVWYGPTGSPDFLINLERLREIKYSKVADISAQTVFPAIESGDLVVDCLFGSGLNKPISGFVSGLVNHINDSGAFVVSVDMPSGLFADKDSDAAHNHIIQADYTLTFEFAKLALLLPENDAYVGQWEVLPIGIHHEYIRDVQVNNNLITAADAAVRLRNRAKFSHKGTYGHALLLAGSAGKTGAAILAAKACLRSGVGLLHVHLPSMAATPVQCTVPEAMLSIDPSESEISRLPETEHYTAIGIGPGIGMSELTSKVLRLLIQESSKPLVLDADALNLLAENKTWLSFLPARSILTPHPKEFERLTGSWSDSYERLSMQRDFSVKFGVYIVFKGAHTTISTPEGECWFNSTGNPGMATGGSGDVLTGMITGLLAQGYSSFEAALLGVYLHGLAGDLAIEKTGMESLIASDIIKNIGKAFAKLMD